jgi:hypothetical protein
MTSPVNQPQPLESLNPCYVTSSFGPSFGQGLRAPSSRVSGHVWCCGYLLSQAQTGSGLFWRSGEALVHLSFTGIALFVVKQNLIAAGVAENQSFSATMSSWIRRTSCEQEAWTNVLPFQATNEKLLKVVDSQEKVCGLAGLL